MHCSFFFDSLIPGDFQVFPFIKIAYTLYILGPSTSVLLEMTILYLSVYMYTQYYLPFCIYVHSILYLSVYMYTQYSLPFCIYVHSILDLKKGLKYMLDL